jgi:hypothetical protein
MAQPIFIFKVALAGRKSIWRKIAMRGDDTLDDLHEMIFDAFDRDDEHLYSFYFPPPGRKMSLRLIMRDSVEYASPFTCQDTGPFSNPGLANAAKTKLASLKLKPKQVFYYLFDYGDEWWHEITVEDVDAPAEKGKYPRVVESRGKSPPQYPDLEDEEENEEE